MNRILVTLSVALGASLVTASTALAQTPVGRGYGGEGGNVQQDVAGGGAGGGVEGAGTASGTLPFTGLDLALLALVAAFLIVTGLVIRRFARANTTA